MSTLSKTVFAVYKQAFVNDSRYGCMFSCRSYFSTGGHTYRGLHDPDELILENSLEEKINDPKSKSKYQQKRPGERAVKEQMLLEQQKIVRSTIVRKKLQKLREEPQAHLLTWAARAQIKHLNKIDPIYWTPEMLSKSFPATKESIIKILKTRRLPRDAEEIYDYDKKIHMNWMKLRKIKKSMIEGGPIDPEFRAIIESGNMNLMINAAGSSNLPIPDQQTMLRTQKEVAESRIPVTKGEFTAILEDYKKDVAAIKDKDVNHIKFKDTRVVNLLKFISGDEVGLSDKAPRTGKSVRRNVSDVNDDNDDDKHSDLTADKDYYTDSTGIYSESATVKDIFDEVKAKHRAGKITTAKVKYSESENVKDLHLEDKYSEENISNSTQDIDDDVLDVESGLKSETMDVSQRVHGQIYYDKPTSVTDEMSNEFSDTKPARRRRRSLKKL